MPLSPIIGNSGRLVHLRADTVALKLTYDTKTERLRIRLHRVSYVTDAGSVNRCCYALVEGFLRHLKKLGSFGVHFPDRESVGRITVISSVVSSAIHRHDVSVLEDVVGRETVHDNIVYRHAERRRETVKPEKAWYSSVVTDKSLSHPIQLKSCHTRSDHLTDFRQCLGNENSILAHQLYFFLCFRRNHFQ